MQLGKISTELDKSLREITEKEEAIGHLFDNKTESYRQMAAAHEQKTKESERHLHDATSLFLDTTN